VTLTSRSKKEISLTENLTCTVNPSPAHPWT
jgi:hypothetical protein